ncbi:MAG: hypothetical protein OCC49_01125 [Fibrobacterales bacterium]
MKDYKTMKNVNNISASILTVLLVVILAVQLGFSSIIRSNEQGINGNHNFTSGGPGAQISTLNGNMVITSTAADISRAPLGIQVSRSYNSGWRNATQAHLMDVQKDGKFKDVDRTPDAFDFAPNFLQRTFYYRPDVTENPSGYQTSALLAGASATYAIGGSILNYTIAQQKEAAGTTPQPKTGLDHAATAMTIINTAFSLKTLAESNGDFNNVQSFQAINNLSSFVLKSVTEKATKETIGQISGTIGAALTMYSAAKTLSNVEDGSPGDEAQKIAAVTQIVGAMGSMMAAASAASAATGVGIAITAAVIVVQITAMLVTIQEVLDANLDIAEYRPHPWLFGVNGYVMLVGTKYEDEEAQYSNMFGGYSSRETYQHCTARNKNGCSNYETRWRGVGDRSSGHPMTDMQLVKSDGGSTRFVMENHHYQIHNDGMQDIRYYNYKSLSNANFKEIYYVDYPPYQTNDWTNGIPVHTSDLLGVGDYYMIKEPNGTVAKFGVSSDKGIYRHTARNYPREMYWSFIDEISHTISGQVITVNRDATSKQITEVTHSADTRRVTIDRSPTQEVVKVVDGTTELSKITYDFGLIDYTFFKETKYRNDPILDASGNPVIDDESGETATKTVSYVYEHKAQMKMITKESRQVDASNSAKDLIKNYVYDEYGNMTQISTTNGNTYNYSYSELDTPTEGFVMNVLMENGAKTTSLNKKFTYTGWSIGSADGYQDGLNGTVMTTDIVTSLTHPDLPNSDYPNKHTILEKTTFRVSQDTSTIRQIKNATEFLATGTSSEEVTKYGTVGMQLLSHQLGSFGIGPMISYRYNGDLLTTTIKREQSNLNIDPIITSYHYDHYGNQIAVLNSSKIDMDNYDAAFFAMHANLKPYDCINEIEVCECDNPNYDPDIHPVSERFMECKNPDVLNCYSNFPTLVDCRSRDVNFCTDVNSNPVACLVVDPLLRKCEVVEEPIVGCTEDIFEQNVEANKQAIYTQINTQFGIDYNLLTFEVVDINTYSFYDSKQIAGNFYSKRSLTTTERTDQRTKFESKYPGEILTDADLDMSNKEILNPLFDPNALYLPGILNEQHTSRLHPDENELLSYSFGTKYSLNTDYLPISEHRIINGNSADTALILVKETAYNDPANRFAPTGKKTYIDDGMYAYDSTKYDAKYHQYPVENHVYKGVFDINTTPAAVGDFVTTLVYNPKNFLETQTNPNLQTTSFTYDDVGRVVSTLNPNGTTIITEHNDAQNYVMQINSTGQKSKIVQDGLGVDSTFITYDNTGTLTQTSKKVYNQSGLIYQQDNDGRELFNYYSDAGRLYISQVPEVKGEYTRYIQTNFEYDFLNRTKTTIDPLLRRTIEHSNKNGQAIKIESEKTGGGFITTQYIYDNFGNLVETIDPNGNSETMVYNHMQQPTTVEYADQYKIEYFYTNQGRLKRFDKTDLSQTPTVTTSIKYGRDGLDRVIADTVVSGLEQLETYYTYDNATFNTTTYAYPQKLVDITRDSLKVNFSYDNFGNLTEKVTRIYPGAIFTSGPTYYGSIGYGYRDDFSVETMTINGDLALTYGRDPYFRNNTISGSYKSGALFDIIKSVTFTPNNMVDQVVYGNNITTTYGYDSNRPILKSIEATMDNAHEPFYKHIITNLGKTGNIERIQRHNGTEAAYEYDKLDRLISVGYPDGGVGGNNLVMAYDNNGNIESFTHDFGQIDYFYNTTGSGATIKQQNTLIKSHSALNGWAVYDYDKNKNRTSTSYYNKSSDLIAGNTNWHVRHEYGFDLLNRMKTYVKKTKSGQSGIEAVSEYLYDYDIDGAKLVTHRKNGAGLYEKQKEFVYEWPNVVYEADTVSGDSSYFVFWGNERIAEVKIESEMPEIYFYHNDHLGTVNQITTNEAIPSVVARYTFDPYGNLESYQGSYHTNYFYTTKEWVPEMGMYYFGARYYDPHTLQWMSTDPLFEFNSPYSYVGGNPLRLIDPDGKDAILTKNDVDNTITIESTIFIYGDEASADVAEQIQGNIMDAWDNKEYMDEETKVKYKVVLKLKVVSMGKDKDPLAAHVAKRDGINFIKIADPNTSYVNAANGRTGEWRGPSSWEDYDNPAAHEFGHLIRLDDKYFSNKAGYPAHPGWKGTIMGESPGEGVVTGKVMWNLLNKRKYDVNNQFFINSTTTYR